MFDIGFWELSVIGVVALLVIGPDRLPTVARTVGFWMGRFRGYVSNMKQELDKELKADELKKILEQQADTSSAVHEIIDEGRDTLKELDGLDAFSQNLSESSVVTDKPLNSNKKAPK